MSGTRNEKETARRMGYESPEMGGKGEKNLEAITVEVLAPRG